jgi:hypothetical protein
MDTRSKSNTNQTDTMRCVGLVILVCLYLVGLVRVEGLHDSVHKFSDQEIHSLINEQDPCHRSLFHNDPNDGCDHKTHVAQFDLCTLCGLALHSEYANDHQVIHFGNKIASASIAEPLPEFLIQTPLRKSPRAPPISEN